MQVEIFPTFRAYLSNIFQRDSILYEYQVMTQSDHTDHIHPKSIISVSDMSL